MQTCPAANDRMIEKCHHIQRSIIDSTTVEERVAGAYQWQASPRHTRSIAIDKRPHVVALPPDDRHKHEANEHTRTSQYGRCDGVVILTPLSVSKDQATSHRPLREWLRGQITPPHRTKRNPNNFVHQLRTFRECVEVCFYLIYQNTTFVRVHYCSNCKQFEECNGRVLLYTFVSAYKPGLTLIS